MQIQSVRAVYFSPTGTSESVVRAIAKGVGVPEAAPVDLTRPEVRAQPFNAAPDELLVVGVPVYMGRIPELLGEWLAGVKGDRTPVVCVAVYGNRAFEDALVEIRNEMVGRGCVSVACAAYIGEHSFSHPDLPTAEGRPDADDLAHAEAFGRKIRERLDAVDSIADLPEVAVPGDYPSEKNTKLWDVDFIAVDDSCVQCGHCAEVCPVGAIDPEDGGSVDVVKCITCCACIKQCPQGARSMKEGPVMEARKRLNNLFSEPRQPELFF